MVILNTRYHFEQKSRAVVVVVVVVLLSFAQLYSSPAQSRFLTLSNCFWFRGFVLDFFRSFSSSASSNSDFVTRAIGLMMTFDQQRARGIKYSIQLVYARTSPILSREGKKHIYRLFSVGDSNSIKVHIDMALSHF